MKEHQCPPGKAALIFRKAVGDALDAYTKEVGSVNALGNAAEDAATRFLAFLIVTEGRGAADEVFVAMVSNAIAKAYAMTGGEEANMDDATTKH